MVSKKRLPDKNVSEHRTHAARDDLARDGHAATPIIYVALPQIKAQLNAFEHALSKRWLPD
jgi:hypothetical protein